MKKIKYYYHCILLISLFGSSATFSYPAWFEIGSYIIEDYASWSKYDNLPNGDESAEKLWDAVNANCTHSYRSWKVNRMNAAVTEASLMNPVSNPNWEREYCDFLFIWPHAHEGNLGNVHHNTIPNGVGKILLSSGDVRLGTAWNRWVFDNGCKTLYNYPDFWPEWRDAFEGLQVYFGFSSAGWGVSWVGDAMEQMIEEWTHPISPTIMSTAYFHGIKDQIYRNGSGLGIKASLLTSKHEVTNKSFCYLTYEDATNYPGDNPGMKISVTYGTPTY